VLGFNHPELVLHHLQFGMLTTYCNLLIVELG
jgi:hypothetical protein